MKVDTKLFGTVDLPLINASKYYQLTHSFLQELITSNEKRIIYENKLIISNPPYQFAFLCEMKDLITDRKVQVIGETIEATLDRELSRLNPVNQAHIRAFDRAVIALLGIKDVKCYSTSEISLDNKKFGYQKIQEEEIKTLPEAPVNQNNTQGDIKETKPADNKSGTIEETMPTGNFIISFGKCKGKNYYEAKDTETFKSFLTWIKEKPDLQFDNDHDNDRKDQLKFFRTLIV